jgi:hypothetical protein
MPSLSINNFDIFCVRIFKSEVAKACRSCENIPDLEDKILDAVWYCSDDPEICFEIERDIISLIGYIWANKEEIGKYQYEH